MFANVRCDEVFFQSDFFAYEKHEVIWEKFTLQSWKGEKKNISALNIRIMKLLY